MIHGLLMNTLDILRWKKIMKYKVERTDANARIIFNDYPFKSLKINKTTNHGSNGRTIAA